MKYWSTKELDKYHIIDPFSLNALMKMRINNKPLITLTTDNLREYRIRRKYTFREAMLVYIYNTYFKNKRIDKSILQSLNDFSLEECPHIFNEIIDHGDYNLFFIVYFSNNNYIFQFSNEENFLSNKKNINDIFYLTINLTKINKETMRRLYAN